MQNTEISTHFNVKNLNIESNDSIRNTLHIILNTKAYSQRIQVLMTITLKYLDT